MTNTQRENEKKIANEKIQNSEKRGKKIMLVKLPKEIFVLTGDTYQIRSTIKKAGWKFQRNDFSDFAGCWYTENFQAVSNIIDVACRSNKFYIQVHISCSKTTAS